MSDVPEELRVALVALRQMTGELLAAHREGEELYESLPQERREAVDRRPVAAYREGLVAFLGFAPPAHRRFRRQALVDVIANLDAVLNGGDHFMEPHDLELLQRGTAAMRDMSTSTKREIARFFDAAAARSEAGLTLKSSGRGRITGRFVAEES